MRVEECRTQRIDGRVVVVQAADESVSFDLVGVHNFDLPIDALRRLQGFIKDSKEKAERLPNQHMGILAGGALTCSRPTSPASA